MSESIDAGDPNARLHDAARGVAESAGEVGALRRAARSVDLRFDPAAAQELRAVVDEHLSRVDG